MKSPPAGRLDPRVLTRFLEHCQQRPVPAGTSVIVAADAPDRLFYLVEGSVEVVIADDEGHEMVLAYLNRGHFFGEMGFFDSDQRLRSARVRARSDCVIGEMSYPAFRSLAESEPSLVIELATQMALRLLGTDVKLGDLAFLDVKGRVAHVLLDLCQEPDAVREDGGWKIRISQSQIARLVGCSREMVWRVVKMLQSEGLISDHDDGILVRVEAPGQEFAAV